MLLGNKVLSADLTVRDVANLCNLSERAVREYISRGVIPSYKVGNSRRIPAEAVEKLRSGRASEYDTAIASLVDAAPKLSQEQRDILAALLAVEQPRPAPKRASRSRGGLASVDGAT